MKKLLLIIAIFEFSATQLHAQSTSGLIIDPATISFSLNKAQTKTEKISITNNLSTRKQFLVYLNDWRRDTTGGHIYLAPGTDPRSCARWIELSKTFFELDSGQTEELTIKMQVPDSAEAIKEMKWAMLFVETVEEKVAPINKGVKTTIQNKLRIGIHVYQTPPLLSNKEVRLLSFTNMADEKNHYRIVCQNSGETQVSCKGYIELSNLADGKVISIDPKEFPLFPEQKRFLDFTLPATVPKGKYVVTGVIDAGSDTPLEAAQLNIEIH